MMPTCYKGTTYQHRGAEPPLVNVIGWDWLFREKGHGKSEDNASTLLEHELFNPSPLAEIFKPCAHSGSTKSIGKMRSS